MLLPDLHTGTPPFDAKAVTPYAPRNAALVQLS